MCVYLRLSGGVGSRSPWYPRVRTSSPCHHRSDEDESGCVGDEDVGEGVKEERRREATGLSLV